MKGILTNIGQVGCWPHPTGHFIASSASAIRVSDGLAGFVGDSNFLLVLPTDNAIRFDRLRYPGIFTSDPQDVMRGGGLNVHPAIIAESIRGGVVGNVIPAQAGIQGSGLAQSDLRKLSCDISASGVVEDYTGYVWPRFSDEDEAMIEAEIDKLKVSGALFGKKRTKTLPKIVLMRVVELLTKHHGLFHPRLLDTNSFNVKLHRWWTQLQGLYKYYNALRKEAGSDRTTVDFMLDLLGVEDTDTLPMTTQVVLLKRDSGRIPWARVHDEVKIHLVERLAEMAQVGHPRFLISDDFQDLILDEIGGRLVGLYDYYHDLKNARDVKNTVTVKYIMDEIGVPSLESLSLEEQYQLLKESELIRWYLVPDDTKRALIDILFSRANKIAGMSCPHQRALNSREFKEKKIEEIGPTLAGLYDRYRREKPADYKGDTLDYMLDRLEYKKFEDLSYEMQCACLKYERNYPWERVPKKTVLRLLSRVAELNSLPHLRFLSHSRIKETVVPETGRSLAGLLNAFKRKSDSREIEWVDKLLDYYGVTPMDQLPIHLQQRYLMDPANLRWRRVPEPLISKVLMELMYSARRGRAGLLSDADFRGKFLGRDAAALGLYTFLERMRRVSGSQLSRIDWALDRYLPSANDIFGQHERLIAFAAKRASRSDAHLGIALDDYLEESEKEFLRLLSEYDSRIGDFNEYIRNLLWRRIVDEPDLALVLSGFAVADKRSASEIWLENISGTTGNARPYSNKVNFKEGDLIEHETFGRGVVLEVIEQRKIRVIFERGERTLICNR